MKLKSGGLFITIISGSVYKSIFSAPQWISATAVSSDILEGTDNDVKMNGVSKNEETLIDTVKHP